MAMTHYDLLPRGRYGVLAVALATAFTALAQQPAPSQPKPAAQPAKKAAAKKPPATPAEPPKPVLEDKAVEILKAASARLAAAKTLAFTALVTYESPTRLGPPLAYTTSSQVLFQRPDRLRVITPGDGPATEFYYDGKTMTAFAPAENLVAVADAPPTVDAMLEAAHKTAAIYYPFADVLVADPYADIAKDLWLAFYVGQSKVVGGTTTDIVVYATGNVLVQAWIGAEDKLPRRMRAIFADDPQQLRHDLEMSNWQVDTPIPADAFATPNAANAKKIAFAAPEPVAPPKAAAPAKAPAKTPAKPKTPKP
jgi:hypothetical protein